MKKFFVLITALLLVILGYSQNRPTVNKELRNMSLKNDQAILKNPRSNEEIITPDNTKLLYNDLIGNTYFDLQTNASVQNRLYLHDDGTIGATFTFGLNFPTFPDRGTGYNYYDGNSWGVTPVQRIEAQRTGWPSYSPWGQEGEIIVSHFSNAPVGGLAINERANKGTGAWTSYILHSPLSNAELLWPRSVTGGANHEVLHVVALTMPVYYGGALYQGQNGAMVYSRSVDGGQTWQIQNTIIPGMGQAYYTGFMPDTYEIIAWNSNVAILIGDDWTDLVVFKSTDNGDNWTKTTIWQHPYPLWDHYNQFPTDTFYCVDGMHTLTFDDNGKIHVVFGICRTFSDGATQYWYPLVDGLAYWNEDMPVFSNDLNALNPYGDPGSELIENYNLIGWMQDINNNGTLDIMGNVGNYRCGASSMPQMIIDDEGIFVFFSSVTETYNNGFEDFRHIWGRKSINLGQDWSSFVDLNSDLIFTYSECIFPTCSPTTDDYLHFTFMEDYNPGLAANGDHPYTENQIKYMKVYKSFNPVYDLGSLAGIVTETVSGNPVQGATIHVGIYSDNTNSSGEYSIYGIPVGSYSASCQKTGYVTQMLPVAIIGDNTTTLNFQIELINLPPPVNLTATVNNNDVLLNWDEPEGDNDKSFLENINGLKVLIGYNVYRNNSVIGNTVNTYYLDENLIPGTYEYFITAVYDNGESAPSNIVWVIGPEPCSPPLNVLATLINQNSIEVTWEPPLTGSPLGYNLYRDNSLIDYTTTLSYIEPNLSPGTYNYCVSTVCMDGESEMACADPVTIANLAPPENLTAMVNGNFINLAWDPPIAPGLLGYRVYYRYENGTFNYLAFTEFTYYVMPEVPAGLHTFCVTASYAGGDSECSEIQVLITWIDNNRCDKLDVYPNPAIEVININSGLMVNSISIYNLFGERISKQKVNDKNFCLNISGYKPGVYLLQIENNEGIFSRRIVIE